MLNAASKEGHAGAMYFHAALVFEGLLSEQPDHARGIALMRPAAALLHPSAIFDMSCAYYNGTGVQRDPAMALQLLLDGDERIPGYASFARGIATLYENCGRMDEALMWAERGAEMGHTACMFQLSCMLLQRAGADHEGLLPVHHQKKPQAQQRRQEGGVGAAACRTGGGCTGTTGNDALAEDRG